MPVYSAVEFKMWDMSRAHRVVGGLFTTLLAVAVGLVVATVAIAFVLERLSTAEPTPNSTEVYVLNGEKRFAQPMLVHLEDGARIAAVLAAIALVGFCGASAFKKRETLRNIQDSQQPSRTYSYEAPVTKPTIGPAT
jgi:hypothetical protein